MARQGSRAQAKITPPMLAKIMAGKFPWRAAPLEDGGGLRLKLSPSGGGSWLVRVMKDGKPIVQGLGSLDVVSAPEARLLAAAFRLAVKKGEDPKEARRQKAAEAKVEAATFAAEVELMRPAIEGSGMHPLTILKWQIAMRRAAEAGISAKRLVDVAPADILKLILPLRREKYETARTTRRHLFDVFEHAALGGRFPTERRNPAEASMLKPQTRYVRKPKVKARPSMPFEKVPAFFARMQRHNSGGAYALMLAMLAGLRTREVIEARWCEFDEAAGVWAVPDEHMKTRVAHYVPISDGIRYVLAKLRPRRLSSDPRARLFPNTRKRKGGEDFATPSLMRSFLQKAMDTHDVVPHGFRQSVRNWGGKRYSNDVMERVLAHAKGGIEGTYHTDPFFDERVPVMQAWSDFCFSECDREARSHLSLAA